MYIYVHCFTCDTMTYILNYNLKKSQLTAQLSLCVINSGNVYSNRFWYACTGIVYENLSRKNVYTKTGIFLPI